MILNLPKKKKKKKKIVDTTVNEKDNIKSVPGLWSLEPGVFANTWFDRNLALYLIPYTCMKDKKLECTGS